MQPFQFQHHSAPLQFHSPPPTPLKWVTVQFGDVVREVNVAERNPLAAGLTRFVGLEHLEPEDLRVRSWGNLTDGTTFTRVFRAGQVLFGKRRAYQRKVAVPDFDGVCSGDIIVLEAKPAAPGKASLLPELLPYILQSEGFFQHAIGTSAGSLSPRTKFKELATYRIALPHDQCIQERTVETLNVTDQAAEHFSDAVDEIRAAKREIFVEMCDAEVSHWATLDEALEDIIAGSSPNGSSAPAGEGEYGVLKVSAVGEEGFIESENKALLTKADFDPVYEVQAGYLLITRANALRSGVGRTCIVESTRPGLMLSDKTLRLVVNPKKAKARFVLEALKTARCRLFIESNLNGTEAKNISQAKLRKAPIPLPEISVQTVLVEKLLQFDRSRRELNNHLDRLRNLKRHLLSHLLTPKAET